MAAARLLRAGRGGFVRHWLCARALPTPARPTRSSRISRNFAALCRALLAAPCRQLFGASSTSELSHQFTLRARVQRRAQLQQFGLETVRGQNRAALGHDLQVEPVRHHGVEHDLNTAPVRLSTTRHVGAERFWIVAIGSPAYSQNFSIGRLSAIRQRSTSSMMER